MRQTRKARLRRKRRQRRVRRMVSLFSLLSLSISHYASPALAYFSDQKVNDVQIIASVVFEKTLNGLVKEAMRSRMEASRVEALAEERLRLCESAQGALEAQAIKSSSIDVGLLSVLQQEQLVEAIIQELKRYREEAEQQVTDAKKAVADAQKNYGGQDLYKDKKIQALQQSLEYAMKIQSDIEQAQHTAANAAAAIRKNIASIQTISERADRVIAQKEQTVLPTAEAIQPIPPPGGGSTGVPSGGGGTSSGDSSAPATGGGGGTAPAPAPDHSGGTSPAPDIAQPDGEHTAPAQDVPASDTGKAEEGSTPAGENTQPERDSDDAEVKEDRSSSDEGAKETTESGQSDTDSGSDGAANP
ncbi:hypothetical protein [Aneurinibacillus sp. REN35]|uniref:hypothetical protein n=1 Tax=Aneurinibacillus sp. REN35 TaxID=3237286 RepID=UPI0035275CF2